MYIYIYITYKYIRNTFLT